MKLFFRLSCPLCLAAFLLVGPTAHAEEFAFNSFFTYFGSFYTASGTLTAVADPNIAGAFDVTGISGTIFGDAITGLLPCATYDPANPCDAPDQAFSYDNVIYPSGTGPFGVQTLDGAGLGFTAGNDIEGKFGAAGTHTMGYFSNNPHEDKYSNLASFAITPIPEPGSFILLGTGLLGIAGTIRRRIAGISARNRSHALAT